MNAASKNDLLSNDELTASDISIDIRTLIHDHHVTYISCRDSKFIYLPLIVPLLTLYFNKVVKALLTELYGESANTVYQALIQPRNGPVARVAAAAAPAAAAAAAAAASNMISDDYIMNFDERIRAVQAAATEHLQILRASGRLPPGVLALAPVPPQQPPAAARPLLVAGFERVWEGLAAVTCHNAAIRLFGTGFGIRKLRIERAEELTAGKYCVKVPFDKYPDIFNVLFVTDAENEVSERIFHRVGANVEISLSNLINADITLSLCPNPSLVPILLSLHTPCTPILVAERCLLDLDVTEGMLAEAVTHGLVKFDGLMYSKSPSTTSEVFIRNFMRSESEPSQKTVNDERLLLAVSRDFLN